jgi:hypothetical protein
VWPLVVNLLAAGGIITILPGAPGRLRIFLGAGLYAVFALIEIAGLLLGRS